MDQEFSDSTEEKLRDETEPQHEHKHEHEKESMQEQEHEHRHKHEHENESVHEHDHQVQGRGLELELEQEEVQGRGLELEDEQGQERGRGHLFGRKKPVHSALGGGKPADVILWRNKQMSGALLAASTVIWLLFEWIGYHLIPFICHFLILALASMFLWSNLSFYVHKSTLNLPVIEVPEDMSTAAALLLRDRCNQAIGILWEVASGKDLKRFLIAIFSLWVVSIVGSWFDFLTIVYIIFVMILTMPSLYEKHEDQVDSYALKAKAKLKRQYTKLDERVLKKLPKVPFITDNKQQ